MTTGSRLHYLPVKLAAIFLAACASQPAAEPEADLGILWVRDAAEYQALAIQAFAAAGEDLSRMIDDRSWSALPDQTDAADLKPAIIFDVDETLVSNVQFQIQLEPPFRDSKLDGWNATNRALPVPGAADFVRRAGDAGVEIFYVTNRPCTLIAGVADPCPQKRITIEDLNEAGIPADAEHVMLASERAEWTQEKKVRRDLIAADYRVIMLIGDDLGDFIPCVRKVVVAPCTEPATQDSRKAQTEKYAAYWGDGWYVLPNPMYGSWTSAE